MMRTYISILDKTIDKAYWRVTTPMPYYSHHIHRHSVIETDTDCGNCDGARCDGCHLITPEKTVECAIPSDKAVEMVKDILMNKYNESDINAANIAADLIYCDGSYIPDTMYRLHWPTAIDVKGKYPEFYESLMV